MRENLTGVSARSSFRIAFGGGGERSPKAIRQEVENVTFLGRKSRSAFGQPAVFLAGNHMTTVAFEKEV